MHIAIIGSRSYIHVIRWANAFVEKGYQVTMYSMHDGWEKINQQVQFVKLPFSNPAGYVLNIPYLRAKIRELEPDIVHSFYAFGHGFLGRYCSQKYPHVVSVLGSDIYDDIYKNRLFKWITVQNILNADAVCSTSHIMAKQIEKECGRIDINITPFGIDTDQFEPADEAEKENTSFIIGTVKWLEHKYGVDILIRAFANFLTKNQNVKTKLLIIGSGAKEYEYKELAKDLGLENHCEFVGMVPHAQVPEWLSKMDVYVALSRMDSESFGVAVLEASATGLPVVVSDAGGLPEIIQNNIQGIVVPKNDAESAAKAFKVYFDDKKLRYLHGKNGIKRVRGSYEWNNSVKVMEQIYKNVLKP
ncbi:glycosyltransferase [Gracilimonas sp.]|uniref:glycosyltransferase n=1 Tax=Gracilimonas sp. TaxID=1974203 RepID=UPI003D0DBBAE